MGPLSKALRQFGGPRHIARRALNLYRNEGWIGVSRGLSALRVALRRQGGDGRNDYEKWIARYDALTDERRHELARRADALQARPLISVIMPVYNPEPRWLAAAIESVRAQIYPEWELCIADDASTDPSIRPLLLRYAAMDARVKVEFRPRNGHISASSNTALALAAGSWVVLFDHDDLLSEDALYWVAATIGRRPDAALIYSDEDKITEAGVRCVPHFKPDWNYDLLLSYNVVCHLGAYRRDLLAAVGGFREGMEGAQDYDLVLRCVEEIEPHQIVHIPRILYHWRMHEGSTAVGAQSKPYALPAGARALNGHFARRGVAAHAELQPAGYYRTHYATPAKAPMVSLVVVCHDGDPGIAAWAEELCARTVYEAYEILLVVMDDNNVGSTEAGTAAAISLAFGERAVAIIEALPDETIPQSVDRAVSSARGDVVVLLEPWLHPVSSDWLSELVKHVMQSQVATAAPRILDSQDRVACAGTIFGIGPGIGKAHRGLPASETGYFHRAVLAQTMTANSPQCLAVRKLQYQKAGGLADNGLPPTLAELDLCLRLREEGYRNVYVGSVALREVSAAADALPRQSFEDLGVALAAAPAEVQRRWNDVLQSDPAYNPNLTTRYEDFSLAWPPRVDEAVDASHRATSPEPGRGGVTRSVEERR